MVSEENVSVGSFQHRHPHLTSNLWTRTMRRTYHRSSPHFGHKNNCKIVVNFPKVDRMAHRAISISLAPPGMITLKDPASGQRSNSAWIFKEKNEQTPDVCQIREFFKQQILTISSTRSRVHGQSHIQDLSGSQVSPRGWLVDEVAGHLISTKGSWLF